MKSFNSIFRLSVYTIICIGISFQNLSAQYDSIFKRPYPRRLQLMDSFMMNCYKDNTADFKTANEEALKLIRYAELNRDNKDLQNLKQQRLNSIYSWTISRGIKYPQFIDEAKQILLETRKSNFKVIEARMLSLIGQYYFSIENNYKLAFENLIKSKEIYQTLPIVEFPEKAYSYYVFATLYYEFNDYESALRISKELEKQEQVSYDKQLLNNDLMGECYVNLMKYDSARLCFQKVLELAFLSNYNKAAWIGIANGKIGETWFYQNNFQIAEPLLKKGFDICNQPEIKLSDNVTVFAAKLSTIYLAKGMFSEAFKYAVLSRENALDYDNSGFVYKNLKSFKFHKNYLKAFSEYYRVQSDYAEALLYQDSFLLYKNKIQQQIDVNEKYNAQISIDKEKEEQREILETQEQQKQMYIRKSLIAVIILLLFLSLLLYDWSVQKQRNKEIKFVAEDKLKAKQLELELQSKNNEIEHRKLLEIKNALIEKSLQDKDVLLKEIHHRVKNNLQIISSLLELQGNRLTDEKAKAAIEEGKGRVMSIALIHQQLYLKEDFTYVDIKPFIRELTTQVSGSLKPENLNIHFSFMKDAARIHIDTAMPLGLILNELLTNSFKYAFNNTNEGSIEIKLKIKSSESKEQADKDSLSVDSLDYFMYKDSGIGLPKDLNINKSKSLGLKLITQLSKQIKGNIEYSYENGACFFIKF